MDMDQEEVVIIQWLRKEGDFIEKGEPVIVIETDKITSEVEAPASGKLTGLLYSENETAPVTKTVAYILEENETEADLPEQTKLQTPDSPSLSQQDTQNPEPAARDTLDAENSEQEKTRVEMPATPAARKIASEKNVKLKSVSGSGPRHRVQASDVKEFAAVQNMQNTTSEPSIRSENSQELSTIRKIIAERMTASYQNIPHVCLTVDVDMHRAEAVREEINHLALQKGTAKISFTTFIVKVITACLKNHPYLNASFENEQIHFWKDINIGIATAIDGGLIVPVVHRADRLSITDLNKRIKSLIQRAREGKLTHDEIKGGTFTISNLGMYGISSFTSIINPPQSAILSIGAIIRKPVVIDKKDTIKVHPIMKLTLAADHRMIDGAVAAHFLVDLVDTLEKPDDVIAF
jgi:pyruvate dehydrogenase E2 component (dihydrolipoamide acetyltransferase)